MDNYLKESDGGDKGELIKRAKEAAASTLPGLSVLTVWANHNRALKARL